MNSINSSTNELDEYVRERLEEADRDVLRAIVESDSDLSGRARRALDYLDELEGQE